MTSSPHVALVYEKQIINIYHITCHETLTCSSHYQHLGGDQHLKYAKKDKNFDAIDLLMSEGLSLDNFMTEQQKIAAFNRLLLLRF